MKSPVILAGVLCVLLAAGCAKEEKKLTTNSAEAVAAYNEGVNHTNNFYYTEARTAFERAIAHDSSFALAWARLAVLAFNTQNEPEAHEYIARAIHLATRATPREQLIVQMWDRRIHFANTVAAAIADSLIKLYPDDPEMHVFRGLLFEMDQNLEAAVQQYKKASDLDTSYAPAAMQLGYAYSTLNEQDKAVSFMERYIRLVPGSADPRASYADLLLRVGRYDEALQQYRQSLQLKPDYWYAFQQIGFVYRTLGRLEAAKEQLAKGFAYIPNSRQLEASHVAADADLEARRGRYHEAVQLYTQAFALDSANLGASYGMVYALAELKEFDKAESMIKNIEKELERRNLNASQAMFGFQLTRAKVLVDEGRLDEARQACQDALDYSSPITRPSVFRQLAEIAIRQDAIEEALDACEQALSVNPNSPDALLTLTKAYHAQGDTRMTREIGNRLLNLWNEADSDFVRLKELRKLLDLPA